MKSTLGIKTPLTPHDKAAAFGLYEDLLTPLGYELGKASLALSEAQHYVFTGSLAYSEIEDIRNKLLALMQQIKTKAWGFNIKE